MEAFVIQPIRARETADHAHFRAIYQRLRDVLKARRYSCHRADDVEKSGAITKDVITRLASADLVVADLTDLNPNVYYELGVRHALRGSGTVMLLDEIRTPDIPFDLSAYRVLRFKGTLQGIGELEDRLVDALDQDTEFGPGIDNPVHDWLPELPENALAAADGSESGELRRQLKEQEDLVSRYRDRFGALEASQRDTTSTPLSVVMRTVSAARDGITPTQLVSEADKAVKARDVTGFLTVIRRALENEVRVAKSEALALAFGADRLGLEQVGRAVLEYATEYLDDDELQQAILGKLAHSNDPEDWALAREGLAKRCGLIQAPDGSIHLPDRISKSQTVDLALLLDALDRDGRHREMWGIAYAWAGTSPNSSFVLRHLARSYAALGMRDVSLEVYRAALGAPDLDDTTPRWLGSDYHNSSETMNALEAYAFAARHDPDDGILFAHAADELSAALRDRLLGRTASDGRRLPEDIDISDFELCVRAALSCGIIDHEALQRIEVSAGRLDVGGIEMSDAARVDLAARHQFAAELLAKLASEATAIPADGGVQDWPDLSREDDWEGFATVGLLGSGEAGEPG